MQKNSNFQKLVKLIYCWAKEISYRISENYFWLNNTNVVIIPFNESRKLRRCIKELIKEWKVCSQ